MSSPSYRTGHSNAFSRNGQAKCWGCNWEGQLGDNNYSEENISIAEVAFPVGVLDSEGNASLSSIASISVNTYHACATLQSGEVTCWGNGYLGGLGDSNTSNHEVYLPNYVTYYDGSYLLNVTEVTTGLYHSCALLEEGKVECWGDKYLLGTGDFMGTADSGEEGLGYPVEVAF